MRIIISNKIYIQNPPSKLKEQIKKTLTLPNPLFYTLKRMKNTKALYGVPENYKYYDEKQGWLAIGRGCERRLRDYCLSAGIEYAPIYRTVGKSCKLKGDVILRDYQKEPYLKAFWKNTNGILRLGTAFGKTSLSCKLSADHGVTTLILTHRGHILSQFQEEFKKWYNYDVGIVQGDMVNIKDVTVAMIQTLNSKNNVLENIKDKFGMVIVDECHTAVTEKRLKIIQSFNPRYLYGLTATPARTDKQDKAIFFTFGDILADADLPRTPPKVKIVTSPKYIEYGEYHEMVDQIVDDDSRNGMIAKIIEEQVSKGRKVLVLTKRIEHYARIRDNLVLSKVFTINSIDAQSLRDDLLRGLRDGSRDFEALLGTYGMLSTGVDVPKLDTLIFAGDLKSEVLVAQSSGRILRLFGDKKEPLIIDIVDSQNKVFAKQARERRRFYEKNNWNIIT